MEYTESQIYDMCSAFKYLGKISFCLFTRNVMRLLDGPNARTLEPRPNAITLIENLRLYDDADISKIVCSDHSYNEIYKLFPESFKKSDKKIMDLGIRLLERYLTE